MTTRTRPVLFDGATSAPPEQIYLRAGAFNLLYEDGTLRHIKVGNIDVLHQIYAAVRDHNWGTVAGEMRDFVMEKNDREFRITFTVHHKRQEIDFVWHGQITGTADNTIVFDFDGIANSTFQRNRIGFCVLHPMTLAGQPCTIEHTDGSQVEGNFPERIAPHQPYFDIRAIQHEVLDGVSVHVLMQGDTFEMEDQRNWIDASYKTYCTPLGLPFPATVNAGDRIHQTITVRLIGNVREVETSAQSLSFELKDDVHALPAIGLGLPSHRELPDTREETWLRALNLAHLRADIRFASDDFLHQLQFAVNYARKLETALELALFVTDNADTELAHFAVHAKSLSVDIARIMIFHENEKSTSRQWVELARKHLDGLKAANGENVAVGAGTDAFFTELNREHPPADLLNFVTYSLNPQVHAFDNLSLVETLRTHVPTVDTAREFSKGADIVVSPVTFKMRWNPNATGSPPPIPAGQLPPQVDPRQMSLFGAGWTVGSIKYLSESDVASMTYFETTGWRGVMETTKGPHLPEKFPSQSGAIFPMYHVFRAVGEFADGEIIDSQSTQPLLVDGLALRSGDNVRLVIANLTESAQTVTIDTVLTKAHVRILDVTSAAATAANPDAFWHNEGKPFDMAVSNVLTLPAYAVAFIDGRGE